MLSMIEAIYFHVPMLCLPFNGDQNTNAAFVDTRNIGKIIISEETTVDAFYGAVHEIITNQQYANTKKHIIFLIIFFCILGINKISIFIHLYSESSL